MFRSIFNLFLISIICITSTTIPIAKNGMDMNFSFHLPKLPAKDSPAEFVYAGDPDTLDLENPSGFRLYVRSAEPQSFTGITDPSLVLEVFQNDQMVKRLTSENFVKAGPQNPDPVDGKLTYALDLSQQNLNLPDGTYVVRIYARAEELKKVEPLTLNITYSTISAYIPATDRTGQGMMGLTLYFPIAEDMQYLVPITRFVKYSRAPLRATIENMRKGSDVFGFLSPIPEVKKIQVRKGMAILHLTSDDLNRYNQNPTDADFAVKSLVTTLTAIPGINQVKFLVDGKESDNIFYGKSTREIFTSNPHPKVYLGLDHQRKRLLLVPVPLENQDQPYESIFRTLKTGEIAGKKLSNLMAPIPQDIDLLNYTLEGNRLTLNVSKEFLNAYPNRPDLQKMILDAIAYSYTSIQGINQIKILVENQPVDAFGNMNLSTYFKRPLFINPEIQ
ncbi:GerMN domain-containing protein [Thermotalea metallivorans]|uniref:GerMN domain-containing protein n=1 Tax=Thermotalea metallivorans TaxID=520762 RepID=A0A140L301_9FIRM|nr:GerMN domain-containing protein [Thermotalea metallivorans]KXG74926.1 hypothetical protein AN619_20250 [Thermotalea metallivorans]